MLAEGGVVLLMQNGLGGEAEAARLCVLSILLAVLFMAAAEFAARAAWARR